MLRSLIEVEGGQSWMKEELIDSFKRSVVALCMMGRAERFLIMAGCGSLSMPMSFRHPPKPEYAEKACEAAAKACGVFPLSIYFYDFGRVLRQVGKSEDARLAFREFLRRVETETLDPIMTATLKQRDLDEAVQYARQFASPA